MRLFVCVTKLSTYGLGSLLHPPREGSAFLEMQIGYHRWPIRESFRPEDNMLPAKAIRSMFRAVINQEISLIQIFVMRENEPLIGRSSEMLFDPQYLVAPGRRIFPRGSGENIGVESFREKVKRFHCSLYGFHECKYARDIIEVAFIFAPRCSIKFINARRKID